MQIMRRVFKSFIIKLGKVVSRKQEWFGPNCYNHNKLFYVEKLDSLFLTKDQSLWKIS